MLKLVQKFNVLHPQSDITSGQLMLPVPEGEIWDIRSVFATFGTSVAVGNRALCVRFDQAPWSTPLRILYVPATTPAAKAIDLAAVEGVAAPVTINTITGGGGQYLMPWSPLTIVGKSAATYISAFDFNAIDPGNDVAEIALAVDCYRFVQERR